MRSNIGSSPGTEVIIFMETTFPAAWTPLSVRAALAKLTLVGSSELSFEMAPARTSASNRTFSTAFIPG